MVSIRTDGAGVIVERVVRPHRHEPVGVPSTKHLIDCEVKVYFLEGDETNKLWKDTVARALIAKCKTVSLFGCAPHSEILPPPLVGEAVDASRGKDIAIIMFYHKVQDRVDNFVKQLRSANPNLYVVFVTGSDFVGRPEDPGGAYDVPGKGIADLVVGKNQLAQHELEASSTWLATHLTNMLANKPIGQV